MKVISRNRQQVTELSIAEKAGVARSTVSRILNNQGKKYRISDKTVEHVFRVAKELNYTPNTMARNLRLQKSSNISLLVGDLGSDWAQCMLNGIEPVLDKNGYSSFIAIHRWDVERERKECNSIISRRDEGVICQPIPFSTNYKLLFDQNVPVVFVSDAIDDLENTKVSYVIWDSAPAAKVAIEHLIEIGRRRIGFIGVRHQTLSTKARYASYCKTLDEAGMEIKQELVVQDITIADMVKDSTGVITKAVERLIRHSPVYPDALFVMNDGIALVVLEVLWKLGIKVPDDIAVVGMGDLPIAGNHAIGLTTVKEPLEEMGRMGSDLLFELLQNPGKGPIKRLCHSADLKIRKTTVS